MPTSHIRQILIQAIHYPSKNGVYTNKQTNFVVTCLYRKMSSKKNVIFASSLIWVQQKNDNNIYLFANYAEKNKIPSMLRLTNLDLQIFRNKKSYWSRTFHIHPNTMIKYTIFTPCNTCFNLTEFHAI